MTFIDNTSLPASPVFDYTSRDYVSIYNDLVARIPLYLPTWTTQNPNDFGIVLIQMFAYVGDLLGYYLDRLAGEAFIQTATQAVSIINLAAMLDYTPTLAVGSTVSLTIIVGPGVMGPVDVPAGTQFATAASPSQSSIVFETLTDLVIPALSSATPSFVGVVSAIQGVSQLGEAVATSDGSVNQIYPLLYSPVSSGSFAVSVDIGLGPQEWTFVQNLINYGATDQVYSIFVDANNVFYIVFGDGVNGLIPPLGSPVTCSYQTTTGSLGNVGANTITQPVSALVGVTGVTNPLAASGGADPEDLISIQINAPISLRTLNRAVTAVDFATLTEQVAGVQWASAVMATYQLVNLYVSPVSGGNPTASLSAAVLAYLNGPPSLIMANTTVTVQNPTYVPINITVNVVAFANYGDTSIQTAIVTALTNLLALANTGFAYRVSLGLVYQTILSVPGVNYAIVTGLNRGMLVNLATALVNGVSYTSLAVSALPQAVAGGDTLILTSGSHIQIVTASGPALVGAQAIPVSSFTANFSYPIGTGVQDTTSLGDAVLLANEIPTAGSLTVSVSGGVVGA